MQKLSVIVPIYNAEKTLYRCIESIIGQSYSNIEIILIDDGSSDNSLMICQEFAKKDSRIIVYHKENEGLVSARKSGVDIATGEYVGFVDSDDFIDAEMYSSLMKEANNNSTDVVISGIITDYATYSTKTLNNLPSGTYDRESIVKKIIPNMLVKNGYYKFGIIPGVVIKIFKRELIKKSLMSVCNDLTMGEDVAITSFSIVNASSISIIDVAAYHYVQTESSMIRGYNSKRFLDVCKMYDCIGKIDIPEYKEQTGAYFACVLYNILSECVKSNDISYLQAKREIKEILNNPVSIKALKSADVSQWFCKDKVKVKLMRYKMVSLLIKLLKR